MHGDADLRQRSTEREQSCLKREKIGRVGFTLGGRPYSGGGGPSRRRPGTRAGGSCAGRSGPGPPGGSPPGCRSRRASRSTRNPQAGKRSPAQQQQQQ